MYHFVYCCCCVQPCWTGVTCRTQRTLRTWGDLPKTPSNNYEFFRRFSLGFSCSGIRNYESGPLVEFSLRLTCKLFMNTGSPIKHLCFCSNAEQPTQSNCYHALTVYLSFNLISQMVVTVRWCPISHNQLSGVHLSCPTAMDPAMPNSTGEMVSTGFCVALVIDVAPSALSQGVSVIQVSLTVS